MLSKCSSVKLMIQAIAGAIFNGRLAQSDFASLVGSATSIDLRSLAQLQPVSLREEVLATVASAIQVRARF